LCPKYLSPSLHERFETFNQTSWYDSLQLRKLFWYMQQADLLDHFTIWEEGWSPFSYKSTTFAFQSIFFLLLRPFGRVGFTFNMLCQSVLFFSWIANYNYKYFLEVLDFLVQDLSFSQYTCELWQLGIISGGWSNSIRYQTLTSANTWVWCGKKSDCFLWYCTMISLFQSFLHLDFFSPKSILLF